MEYKAFLGVPYIEEKEGISFEFFTHSVTITRLYPTNCTTTVSNMQLSTLINIFISFLISISIVSPVSMLTIAITLAVGL